MRNDGKVAPINEFGLITAEEARKATVPKSEFISTFIARHVRTINAAVRSAMAGDAHSPGTYSAQFSVQALNAVEKEARDLLLCSLKASGFKLVEVGMSEDMDVIYYKLSWD